MPNNNHALVIGASGLIGWSAVNQLLLPYPTPSPFSKITALVNRPLELSNSFWPEPAPGRPELSLISGMNLLSSDEEFQKALKDNVKDIHTVSHVYYFAFKEVKDPTFEVSTNLTMLRRLVHTLKSLSPNFSFLVYPGGTRGYGIYRPDGIFSAPLVEEMADTLPEDYAKTVSYPHYRAMLKEESARQKWSWCELCPDVIVGFTPNGSAYSLAGHWAVYLYTYRLVFGEGAKVKFPGTREGYESRFTETSAGMLARVGVYASLHPGEFGGKVVNVADTEASGTMGERWPQIARFFGLKGVEPGEGASVSDEKPSDFIREHRGVLEREGVKGVDIWNPGQLDSVGYWLTFDRQLSLKRLRNAGFEEEQRPEEGWLEAFEMFRKAGMIR